MSEKEVKIRIAAETSDADKKLVGVSKKLGEARKAVLDLNTALVGSAKLTKKWQDKLSEAFGSLQVSSNRTKDAEKAAKGLGVSMSKMAREMLQSGFTFVEVANAIGKTEDQLRRLLGISPEKFVKVLHDAGMSSETLGIILGKTVEQINKLIPATTSAESSIEKTDTAIQNLDEAFRKIISVPVEEKFNTLGQVAHQLGMTQRKMAEEMLKSGIGFRDLATAMGKTEDGLRDFIGLGQQKFVKMMHDAGTSTEELARILGKTTEETQKIIAALEPMSELGTDDIKTRWEEATSALGAYRAELEFLGRVEEEKAKQQQWTQQRLPEPSFPKAPETAMSRFASAVDRARNAYRKMVETMKGGDGSVNKASGAWTALAKKIGLWAIGAASAFRAYMTIRRNLEESIETIYGNSEAYKDLKASFGDFWNSVVISLADRQTVEDFFTQLTNLVYGASDAMLELNANTKANIAVFDKYVQEQSGAGNEVWREKMAQMPDFFKSNLGAFLETVFPKYLEYANQVSSEQMETLRGLRDQYKDTGTTVDEFDSKIQSLISSMRQVRDITAEYNEAMRESQETMQDNIDQIVNDWYSGIQTAWKDYQSNLYDITVDYNEKIADINKKYDDQALKAQAQALKTQQKQLKDTQLQIEQFIAQHNLQMKHMAQQHNLSMLQNQMMYEAERKWLIAEGDTLAIDRLDKQHELEQQIAEENYKLQKKQQEEMFQLQLKYMKEAMAIQAQELANALAEQLAEIERARQEELAEAEKAKEKEKQQAQKDYDDELNDLSAAKDKQLQEEEEANAKREQAAEENRAREKAALAQHLVDLGLEWGLGIEDIQKMAASVFGEDSELAGLIASTFIQTIDDTKKATDAIEAFVKKTGDDSKAMVGDVATTTTSIMDTAKNAIAAGKSSWVSSMNEIRTNTNQTTQSMIALAAAAMAARNAMMTVPTGSMGGGRGTRPKQFGGDFIASTPTPIMVGEGYSPERVTVTPLSPIGGGTFTHRWGGGSIPIEGRGSMAGADMQAVVQAMAKNLMTELTSVATQLRGQRG